MITSLKSHISMVFLSKKYSVVQVFRLTFARLSINNEISGLIPLGLWNL